MQPPISAGTVLQNRYRLLSILGQGGFGRTYLSEDLGRFNERCALKEFIPSQTGEYALQKSKELFQREAAILYQIQHPQIPQFRATFEENQRLFLVQDYVEGKTYRALLNERKAQNRTFSEAEVLQLMRQLMPVLAHIHAKGIIHRDISPDNIILRQSDYSPILIDFGVVKEIVTRVQQPGTVTQATTVGKLGYAPSEQMQTGRAYPSSDLYSLAVTAVVLLTGQEPQDLYDDVNLTWHWQQYANQVTPGFAQILNKMMSYRPGDRYQSVSEVAQALQAITNPAAAMPQGTTPAQQPPQQPPQPSVQSPFANQPPITAAPPANPVSQMQTIAVGRRPVPATGHTNVPTTPRRPHSPNIPNPSQQTSVWDNPLAVIGIGLGLAIVTGVASWAVVSALLNSQQSPPIASPTPTLSVSPSDTPSASPTPSPSNTPKPTPEQPVEFDQRLNLAAGATTTARGNLRGNQTVNYIVTAEAGETLSATLDGNEVVMTVLDPNGQPVDNQASQVLQWNGTAPVAGEYVLRVKPLDGISRTDYSLKVSLSPAPSPSTEPEPEPPSPSTEPEPEPNGGDIVTDSISIPSGQDSVEVANQVRAGSTRRYLVQVEGDQRLTVELIQGDTTFTVRYPSGQAVDGASNTTYADLGPGLAQAGNYQIDVSANQTVNFVLKVGVSN